MRAIRLMTVIMAAALAAACATDRQTARATPPTQYAQMGKSKPFGVLHHDRDDGWTEILVRVNESSPRERARDMAYYYAARLGEIRKAKSLYVLGEEADMYCRLVDRRGPGLFIIGNPILMAASFAFSAASMSSGSKSFDAFPIHLLMVSLSQSTMDAEGMKRIPVNEVLAALQPRFEPGKPLPAAASPGGASAAKESAKNRKARNVRVTEADRQQWANNAEANVAVCMERYQRQQEAGKAAPKDLPPQTPNPDDVKGADEADVTDEAGVPEEPAEESAEPGNPQAAGPADGDAKPE
jgi:hypothetical protein